MWRTTLQRKQRKIFCRNNSSESDEQAEVNLGSAVETSDQARDTGDNILTLDSAAETSDQAKDTGENISTHTFHNSDRDTDSSSDESGVSTSGASSESDGSHSSSVHSSNSDRVTEESESESESDDDESDIKCLYDGSNMTSLEGLLRVLKLFVEEGWTKRSLDKNVKLLKKMLPEPNELPSSGKAALKKLESLTSSCNETEYLYCNDCLQLSGTNVDTCDHSVGFSKFYTFPIGEQIKHMLEQRSLASAIEFYHDHNNRKEGFICDIVDGAEYKKVKEHLPNLYDLILLWNTDGLALSSSSQQEMWLVLATICEVPPRLRSSFMVIAGVYVGKKKPDMNVFLKPFSDSLLKLYEDGVSWVHPVLKMPFTSKIVAPVLSADAPAKAAVVRNKNHNSRFGCNTCEQKSKKIQLSAEEMQFNENNPGRKRKRRKRRFLFQEDVASAPLRSGMRMNLLADMAERRGKSRRGVIGRAVISNTPHLD